MGKGHKFLVSPKGCVNFILGLGNVTGHSGSHGTEEGWMTVKDTT